MGEPQKSFQIKFVIGVLGLKSLLSFIADESSNTKPQGSEL